MKLTYEGPLSSEWTQSCEALIGVFDILGFQSMIEATDSDPPGKLEALAKSVEVFVKIVDAIGGEDAAFESFGKKSASPPRPLHVSDTFFLYTQARGTADLLCFLWTAHSLVFHSIVHGFPFRGALATGELFINEQHRIILGHSLVEAYEFGQRLDWAGAALTPSLENYIEEIGFRDRLYPLILSYDLPFKDARVRNSTSNLCINWVADVANYLNPEFVETKFPINDIKQKSVREKIGNTRSFLQYALKQGKFSSPSNRRIVLGEPEADGGRPIQFVIDRIEYK